MQITFSWLLYAFCHHVYIFQVDCGYIICLTCRVPCCGGVADLSSMLIRQERRFCLCQCSIWLSGTESELSDSDLIITSSIKPVSSYWMTLFIRKDKSYGQTNLQPSRVCYRLIKTQRHTHMAVCGWPSAGKNG